MELSRFFKSHLGMNQSDSFITVKKQIIMQMKTTIKPTGIVNLTITEQIDIIGGSERKDKKRAGIWDMLTNLLFG